MNEQRLGSPVKRWFDLARVTQNYLRLETLLRPGKIGIVYVPKSILREDAEDKIRYMTGVELIIGTGPVPVHNCCPFCRCKA